jgi:hypothetical protein
LLAACGTHRPRAVCFGSIRKQTDWDAAQAKWTRRAFLERYPGTDTLVCTAHFLLPLGEPDRRAG